MIPGEIICSAGKIKINLGKKHNRLLVTNLGDRPIQVGSHFHFFEANRNLQFDRRASLGYRLDIPAGTAIRFEPGDSKTVQLVQFTGYQRIMGFNNLVNNVVDLTNAESIIHLMRAKGFADVNNEANNER